jgi:hypothetical protein
LSRKSENSLSIEQQVQRSKYLQCMHAGYNEWLLSASLGQVPPLLLNYHILLKIKLLCASHNS